MKRYRFRKYSLVLNGGQSIIQTTDDAIYWRMCVSKNQKVQVDGLKKPFVCPMYVER